MPEIHTTRRLQWLLRVLLIWICGIVARLIFLQVVKHDELARAATGQQQKSVEIQAPRGAILDRSGQALAKSLPAESICVNPQKIPDLGMAAELLSRVLELDRNKIHEKLTSAAAKSSGFLWIKRKVAADEAARLRSLKLDWVEFRPEMRRYYPHSQLAAHVVGSVGNSTADDMVEVGNAGVELAFDSELAGRPGLSRMSMDVRQNPYDSVLARKPEPGVTITLTIDRSLQYEVEKQLEKAVIESNARSGSAVVLNPYTGDILAMANYPTFDPNVPPVKGDAPLARSNLAIAAPYEPGSVMKVFTVATAIENNRVTPETVVNCGNGTINLFGRIIHDDHHYSALSVADVLAHSSNIGAIQVGLKIGDRLLEKYERAYGFGRRTGIDLPGESAGQLRAVKDWTASSIGSVAMGHEIGVTALQLGLGGCVMANGGMLIKPRIIAARQRPGQPIEHFAPEKPERVLRPETTIQMRQMMEGVVLRGTGKHAVLDGYTSAGKTGSAQIYDPETKSYTHKYNASFLGFAPVGNPQVVVAVTINATTGGRAGYGGAVAAPVFREIAMTALRILDVPKDRASKQVLTSNRPLSSGAVESDLAIAGLGKNSAPPSDETAGNRSVSSVTPPPVPQLSPARAGEESVDRRPFLPASFATGGGTKAPDFRGMTLRAVLQEAAARGVEVDVEGSGLVRVQEPPAGAVMRPGARVRLQFSR
jgi:cell division protein FtsI (penicillin-binding protein 3)